METKAEFFQLIVFVYFADCWSNGLLAKQSDPILVLVKTLEAEQPLVLRICFKKMHLICSVSTMEV